MPSDEFNTWPEAKRHEVQHAIQVLERTSSASCIRSPQWEKERRDKLRRRTIAAAGETPLGRDGFLIVLNGWGSRRPNVTSVRTWKSGGEKEKCHG